MTSIYKWYSIRFIGRPFELHKVTNDNRSLIANKEEANKIITANHLYYGSMNTSFLISFIIAIKLSKNLNKTKKPFLTLCMSALPIAFTYLFIHIKSDYYFVIRETIIESRARQNKYLKNKIGFNSPEEKNELKLLLISSIENSKYIYDNTGFFKSIKGCIRYYLNI